MKQNITITLEKNIIKKGKILAAQKDTSISKMLGGLLKEIINKEDRYEAAKRNALELMEKGLHLGGRIVWNRESLHER
jgi:hypothetical protein